MKWAIQQERGRQDTRWQAKASGPIDYRMKRIVQIVDTDILTIHRELASVRSEPPAEALRSIHLQAAQSRVRQFRHQGHTAAPYTDSIYFLGKKHIQELDNARHWAPRVGIAIADGRTAATGQQSDGV
jgi:hypothetical protein